MSKASDSAKREKCVEKIVMGSNMDREDSMLYIKALEQGTGDINWMVRLSKMGLEGQILQMAKEGDN